MVLRFQQKLLIAHFHVFIPTFHVHVQGVPDAILSWDMSPIHALILIP